MVEFTFRVNKSFQERRSHPITVPKGQVDYAAVEAEGLVGPATIVAPDGRRVPGKVYAGVAGYGPYYQVRADRHEEDPLGRIPLGSRLRVAVRREGDGRVVEVSTAPSRA